jgi:hypothetical protein
MSFKNWNIADVNRHNERVAKSLSVSVSEPDAVAFKPPKAAPRQRRQDISGRVGERPIRKPAYTQEAVKEWCRRNGLSEPVFEHKFHPIRKWRMDIAWPDNSETAALSGRGGVALEVQGGIFINGGHNRGAQLLKEWEKYHAAQALGWKLAWTTPKDLLTEKTASIIKELMQ